MILPSQLPLEALTRADERCASLSGLHGFADAAMMRARQVLLYEEATGKRVQEPERSLWLRQAEIELAAARRAL